MAPRRVRTIPPGMTYEPGNLKDRLCSVNREAEANTVRYNGNYLKGFFGWKEGEGDFYLIATNNEPFRNKEEILEVGLVPNVSTGEYNAFQGCGLWYCACLLSSSPMLLIASRGDLEKDWLIGRGYPDYDRNEVITEDITDAWNPWLKTILGNETFSTSVMGDKLPDGRLPYPGLRVIYGFKVLPPKTLGENRNFLNIGGSEEGSPLATMCWSADGLSHNRKGQPIRVFMQTRQIGFPFPDPKDRLTYTQRRGRETSWGDLTVSKDLERRGCSLAEYRLRYALEGGHGIFHCEVPFYAQLNSELKVEITKARVEVEIYPGHFDRWILNERDGECDGHVWTKGTYIDYGVPPHKKVFLVLPCASQGVPPEEQERWDRFKTNAVLQYQKLPTVMSLLNLSYGQQTLERPEGRFKPFPVVRVFIEEIGEIYHNDEPQAGLNARNLLGMLGRRADFTLDPEKGGASILKAALIAARDQIPEDFRHLCQEWFPEIAQERVVIFETAEPGRGANPPLLFFDVEMEGTRAAKHWEPGKARLLALYDRTRGRWLTDRDVQITNQTRGVDVTAADAATLDERVPEVDAVLTRLQERAESLEVQDEEEQDEEAEE